jgi:prolyl-tRNA editing enzyme YbaK/EbsC (Cys-tRNA(Pro) deacylase)
VFGTGFTSSRAYSHRRSAVKQVGADPGRIIKTLILIDDEGNHVAAIIPGNKRLSLEKLSRVISKKA